MSTLLSAAANALMSGELAPPLLLWQARNITVVTDPPKAMVVDGELIHVEEIVVRLVPQAVGVVVPRLFIGLLVGAVMYILSQKRYTLGSSVLTSILGAFIEGFLGSQFIAAGVTDFNPWNMFAAFLGTGVMVFCCTCWIVGN